MEHKLILLAALLAGTALFVAAPALIALFRKHPERRLIYKLTPLAILSLILWFVLIAWAWGGARDDAEISRYVARLRGNGWLPLAIAGLVVIGAAGAMLTVLR